MQRPAILPAAISSSAFFACLQRPLFSQSYDEMQFGVVAFQAIQIHRGEIKRGNVTVLEQATPIGNRMERKSIEMLWIIRNAEQDLTVGPVVFRC